MFFFFFLPQCWPDCWHICLIWVDLAKLQSVQVPAVQVKSKERQKYIKHMLTDITLYPGGVWCTVSAWTIEYEYYWRWTDIYFGWQCWPPRHKVVQTLGQHWQRSSFQNNSAKVDPVLPSVCKGALSITTLSISKVELNATGNIKALVH